MVGYRLGLQHRPAVPGLGLPPRLPRPLQRRVRPRRSATGTLHRRVRPRHSSKGTLKTQGSSTSIAPLVQLFTGFGHVALQVHSNRRVRPRNSSTCTLNHRVRPRHSSTGTLNRRVHQPQQQGTVIYRVVT